MNYKDEQRDNAIYDNEMVYFLFLDGITKTKPYFDIYTLFTYFLFNEIEKKRFLFYRDVKLPPINEKRCNLVMQFFQHVTRNVQFLFFAECRENICLHFSKYYKICRFICRFHFDSYFVIIKGFYKIIICYLILAAM